MNQSSANGGTKARLHEGPLGPHKLPPRRLSELVFCHRPLTHFAPIMGSWQVVLPVDSLQAPWEGELPTPALSRASHGSMTWGGGGGARAQPPPPGYVALEGCPIFKTPCRRQLVFCPSSPPPPTSLPQVEPKSTPYHRPRAPITNTRGQGLHLLCPLLLPRPLPRSRASAPSQAGAGRALTV